MKYIPLFSIVVIGCSEYELTESNQLLDVPSPNIVVDPLSITFDQLTSDETEVRELSLGNNGDGVLEVVGVLVEGSAAFTISNEGFPLLLDSGEETTINVLFSPITGSDVAEAVVISSDPDDNPVTVPLNGTWAGPELLIEPSEWDYEGGYIDCEEETRFTLTNVGTDKLELYSVGTNGDSFSISASPDYTAGLEPGESTWVDVDFIPDDVLDFEGLLWVSSNDPVGIREAPLLGVGSEEGRCAPTTVNFIVEYDIADIAFILDTTGSMGGLASAMASEFSDIADELNDEVENLTFGVVAYQDYAYGSMGGGSDRPFNLLQQQTDSLSDVESSLNSISASGGGDGQESTMEALFQAATGDGYDQDCDGSYDSGTDVKPFIEHGSDAFGGSEAGVYDSGVSGTGVNGGLGFRDDVLPILIYATDAPLRDPDNGYEGPEGCNQDAGFNLATDALKDIDAAIIGVGVGYSTTTAGYTQMTQLAEEIGSFGDMDGDGTDEPAVVTWQNTSSTFKDTIVDAVKGMIDEEDFSSVWLEVEDDDYNMVDSISPQGYDDVESGAEVDFTVTVNSAVVDVPAADTYEVVLGLYGSNGSVERLLDTWTLNVQIP